MVALAAREASPRVVDTRRLSGVCGAIGEFVRPPCVDLDCTGPTLGNFAAVLRTHHLTSPDPPQILHSQI